ncbi:unnamed protein product [Ceutorhynchus assimilis]|uniref:Uncharacterized protein n=1 Tax=Ceutorhynchus assimilis TaxID=467358 RepID=A0A9N9MPY8_9CUCU|nr:unnamed protein product [Ceutorhynchus assimilis]
MKVLQTPLLVRLLITLNPSQDHPIKLNQCQGLPITSNKFQGLPIKLNQFQGLYIKFNQFQGLRIKLNQFQGLPTHQLLSKRFWRKTICTGTEIFTTEDYFKRKEKEEEERRLLKEKSSESSSNTSLEKELEVNYVDEECDLIDDEFPSLEDEERLDENRKQKLEEIEEEPGLREKNTSQEIQTENVMEDEIDYNHMDVEISDLVICNFIYNKGTKKETQKEFVCK